MDRREAVKLLRAGGAGIRQLNKRRADGEIVPALANVNLSNTDLSGVNLAEVSLLEANLEKANLSDAKLAQADLRTANLSYANLTRADLTGTYLGRANLHHADLSYALLKKTDLQSANLRFSHLAYVRAGGADLTSADLNGADLSHALLQTTVLRRADLSFANLARADLSEANLSGSRLVFANCRRADFTSANLVQADLTGAYLSRADLTDANLQGAKLNEASFGYTTVACNLAGATGLEETIHRGQSHVSVAAIFFFKDGKLPEGFLRGCGLRDEEIAYFRQTMSAPQQYYSCFISHSSAEEALVTRLYDDLQDAGIRCWKWDHDAASGKSKWGESDRVLHRFDRMLLIASESSLKSEEVNKEIEQALRVEAHREEKLKAGEFRGSVDVLFPVRADDFMDKGWESEHKAEVMKRDVRDARGWDSDPKIYERILESLLTALKQEGEFLD